MSRMSCTFSLALILGLCSFHAAAEQRSLSQDWRFQAGAAEGAEQNDFNDAGWRQVVVPHDYSIVDKPDGTPPFDRQG